MSRRHWSVVAVLVLSTAVPAWPDNGSAPAAQALTALLNAKKLDAIAARVPDTSDQFVAALYYPNAQLLVVTAHYSAPSLLQEKIWSHKYRDVYTALYGGGTPEGKFFVVDMGANGLPAKSDEAPQIDVVYVDGTQQTTFNNDWRAQKLSKTEYDKRLDAADPRYTRMLEVLAAELKVAGTR